MSSLKNYKQRGMSLLGIIFVVVVVIFFVLLFVRTAPSVAEYFTVRRVVSNIVSGGSDEAIRQNYTLQSRMEGLRPGPLKAEDLKITISASGVTTIKFAYDKEINLFGPVYLLIKYEGGKSSSGYK